MFRRFSLPHTFVAPRVMVLVDGARLNADALVAAAFEAQQRHARGYAVHVKTPRSPGDVAVIDRAFTLAESFSLLPVRVRADSQAQGLIEFVRREGVTTVILSRSGSPVDTAGESLVNALKAAVRGVDVRVVADPEAAPIRVPATPHTSSRARSVMLAMLAALAIYAALIWAPWPLPFLVAATGAGAWCWWLDRSASQSARA